MSLKFELGDQPDWAGTEECIDLSDPKSYVCSLLSPDLSDSSQNQTLYTPCSLCSEVLPDSKEIHHSAHLLISKGYCVLPIPKEVRKLYDDFHYSLENFCSQPLDPIKRHFALTFSKNSDSLREEEPQTKLEQRNDLEKHSTNQFHGYSSVSGLKEQFMLRVFGTHQTDGHSNKDLLIADTRGLECPSETDPKKPDLGLGGTLLYLHLDDLCREVQREVAKILGLNTSTFDSLLDPLPSHKVEEPFSLQSSHTFQSSSKFYSIRQERFVSSPALPPAFISSSILDCFHYWNTAWRDEKSETEEKLENRYEIDEVNTGNHDQHSIRFVNNHASHTDSGLMTGVIITDEPGLEVYDQSMNEWIKIEKYLHDHFSELKNELDDKSHRNYITLFWGDSVCYLPPPPSSSSSNEKESTTPSFFQKISSFFSDTPIDTQKNQPSKYPEACIHRVASCQKERYSIVFKQRTSPLKTACRYQEDYHLAFLQMGSV